MERVALHYYAPMWKTTPTASLQILLNKKPSHLEITSVSIKNLYQVQRHVPKQPLGMVLLIIYQQTAILKHSNQGAIEFLMRELPLMNSIAIL